jgi:hypothetical protein
LEPLEYVEVPVMTNGADAVAIDWSGAVCVFIAGDTGASLQASTRAASSRANARWGMVEAVRDDEDVAEFRL